MTRKIISIILFLSLAIFSFSAKAASSQGGGLTISPPLLNIDLEPGKNYNQVIKLNNPTKDIVEVYPVARNFTASGETGVPAIEAPDANPNYGLASWISFSSAKIVLTPEQEAQFAYKITVPKDAEPGGHYGSVLFASQPPKIDEQATQVALASMVGSLILANVSGAVVEKAEVKEFSTTHWIFFKSPADFILRINNTGNTHVKPMGDIIVKNWGRKLSDSSINPNGGNILPNSTRKFDKLTFKASPWAFGRFTANLVAVYGSKNAPLTANLVFWIIPWWLIVVFALIILLIIFYIWRKKRKKPKVRANNDERKFVLR